MEFRRRSNTFKTDAGWTWSLAVTADGRRAISAGGDCTVRVWDLEGDGVTATFTGDGSMLGCSLGPDDRTIIASDSFGHIHFLSLVEADETKSPIGDTKIPLLHRKEQES